MAAHAETLSAAIVNSTIVSPEIVDCAAAGSVNAQSVIETMKRVSDEALGLLDRRSQINRRIHELHQLLHGLNDLSTNTERLAGRDTHANTRRRSAGQLVNPLPRHESSRRECIAVSNQLPHSAKHAPDRLRRACRIALLETGGAASLEEIHARIVRRGSLAFVEPDSCYSAIFQTLYRMAAGGEIRRIEDHPQPVWERITLVEEVAPHSCRNRLESRCGSGLAG